MPPPELSSSSNGQTRPCLSQDRFQVTTELSRTVLRQTWTEFYKWEQGHCQKLIDSLRAASPDFCDSASINSEHFDDQDEDPDEPGGDIPLMDLDNSSCTQVIDIESIPCVMIEITSRLAPSPRYEACTPANRSIEVGDDDDCMQFVPFADDAAFNVQDCVAQYGSLSWEEDMNDPDLQMIFLEAVRRLHFIHLISLVEIDETCALPVPVLSTLMKAGLLQTVSQRDLLEWPGSSSTSKWPVLRQPKPEASDLRARVQEAVLTFCPNLSCIQSICAVHRTMPAMPPSARRTFSEHDYENVIAAQKNREPCGHECFLLSETQVEGSQQEWDVLTTILDITPELPPCDLAVVARISCSKTYSLCRKILAINRSSLDTSSTPTRKNKLLFDDWNAPAFTPGEPCCHEKSCSKARCSCFVNNAHCTRNCLCPLTCTRRWKGCRCGRSRGKQVCGTQNCPCYRARRECDPEVCVTCDAKKYPAVDTCRNSQIQQGRCKFTVVKRSEWGFGLFINEIAHEGDLIVEYIGELIFEPTVQSRDCVAEHRGRGYVYGLNESLRIDSSHVGSNARFINHSSKRANCRPGVFLVNGEHRIGIYARRTIHPGRELFLDYGQEFFKNSHGGSGSKQS